MTISRSSDRMRLARPGTTYSELSISNGRLRLADATFSDPVGIITSRTKVANGIHIVAEDSALATVNTIANAALWVWPITRDSAGNKITGTVNLTERDNGLWIVERYNSLPPTLLTCFVGFCDTNDPRSSRQQLQAIEWGNISTTNRRGGIITVDAGGAETRTVGAGVVDEHLGYSGESRRNTHEQEGQFKGYPIGFDGTLSETPGANNQVSTAVVEMHQTGYFFFGVNWNSTAGSNGVEIIVDPSFHLSPVSVPS